MGIQQQSMKVHQLTRGLWNNNQHEPTSLTLGCKRLRPLAPKINSSADTTANASFDLKSFIRPDNGQRKPAGPSSSSVCQKKDEPPSHQQQVESQQAAGGTRWNPTQEQIGILEMLYKSGMRTPNAQQIEQITAQLGKYGKIEGKNVFYWFQNHKARERQKQKRGGNNNLGLCNHMSSNTTHRALTSSVDCSGSIISATALSLSSIIKGEELEGTKTTTTTYKRKCSAWAFDQCTEEEDEGEDRTLELFPLKPELGR